MTPDPISYRRHTRPVSTGRTVRIGGPFLRRSKPEERRCLEQALPRWHLKRDNPICVMREGESAVCLPDSPAKLTADAFSVRVVNSCAVEAR